MADYNAMAVAIATRLLATTPPSGLTAIRRATSELPADISVEPTVLVFPPEPGGIDLHTMNGLRSGNVTFPVRFYLWRIRDNARNAVLVNKWLGALIPQLDGQCQLGVSGGYVGYAEMKQAGAARLTYGGAEFDGIVLEAVVHIAEGTSPVA